MPSCIVKGCTHYTGMKTSNPLLTMHVFPREFTRIKLWLQQTGQDFGDIDAFATKILDAAKSGKYRICSAHFDPGSYTSQGSRIVLKQDAVPTLFPGIYPKPPQYWKPFAPQAKKYHIDLDIIGERNSRLYVNAGTPKQPIQKREVGTQTDIECQKAQQEVTCHNISLQGTRKSPTESSFPQQLLDVDGQYVFCHPDARQNELKPKQSQHIYSLHSQIPKDCYSSDSRVENRSALIALENIMVSLLQHLTEAPLTTRPQKQKTTRLLNRAAVIISILTGEEWTVVKKNAHISKFYQMIREVPIKCGDVAVFFTMDEWDYIEEHEDHYKHVMLENPLELKSMQPSTNSDSLKEEILESNCEQSLSPITEQPAGTGDVVIPENYPDTPQCPTTSLPLITDDYEGICSKEEDNDINRMECSTVPILLCQPSTHSHCFSVPRWITRKGFYEECIKWDTMASPHESPSSELWIAQDGTTSSQWIPQDDPRPPGWGYNTYRRKRPLLQCPVSLSCDNAHTVNTEISRSDHEESNTLTQDHWCELCDKSFADKHELVVHEITHTKKQRP
ncbi:uncharacterized protein LOC135056132 isoform X2 [Pseudophryne corroboree]|uniref:uncharacterized protein LOC135056132 isoform X2 n=1 Tax=Pseudophryne corroboree TaxID=495146 RepID=UPI003081D528